MNKFTVYYARRLEYFGDNWLLQLIMQTGIMCTKELLC